MGKWSGADPPPVPPFGSCMCAWKPIYNDGKTHLCAVRMGIQFRGKQKSGPLETRINTVNAKT